MAVTCTKYRCHLYKKGNLSPCGITNCTANAWQCVCSIACQQRNYALSLNPTGDNVNGTYTADTTNATK